MPTYGYGRLRAAQNRENCTNCRTSDAKCTDRLMAGGRACCSVCMDADSHPRREEALADPREGAAFSVQSAMFSDPESIETAPVKPYAGEHGHAGSETSAARAKSTRPGKAQRHVMECLAEAKAHGATVQEIRDTGVIHHGSASGALSELHKSGIICRLTTKRSKCKIYCLPEWVVGRKTDPPGSTKASGDSEMVRRIRRAREVEIEHVEHVRLDGDDYYLAADLLAAITEGISDEKGDTEP